MRRTASFLLLAFGISWSIALIPLVGVVITLDGTYRHQFLDATGPEASA